MSAISKSRHSKIMGSRIAAGDVGIGADLMTLTLRLQQASAVLADLFETAVGRDLGLTQTEFFILSLVDQQENWSARDLARAIGVWPPRISTALQRLSEQGLIASSTSKADQRVRVVRSSESGHGLLLSASRAYELALANALGASSDELPRLLPLLRRLVESAARPAPSADEDAWRVDGAGR